MKNEVSLSKCDCAFAWTFTSVTFLLFLVHQRIVQVEDGFLETDDHETGIRDFLDERNLIVLKSKLVSEGKVRIGTGNNTVVVHDNNLFVGDLSLRVAKDSVVVNVPRIIDLMIVQDALLVGHHHILIRVQDIDNTKLVGRHSGGREFKSRREPISLNNSDQIAGPRNGKSISNVSRIQFEWVKSQEFLKVRRILQRSISRLDLTVSAEATRI